MWDSREDTANLTRCTVPEGQLAYSTTYWWQVRHKDSQGLWSAYSTRTSFTTASRPTVLAAHSAGDYVPGGTLTVTSTITFTGQPAALGWQAQIPAGWTYQSGTDEPGTKPAAGQTGTLEWAWQTVPPSPVQFTYTLRVPEGESGEQQITALAIYREAGELQQPRATPDPLRLRPVTQHSADTDRDWRMSLLELTRVIELYNYRAGTVRTGEYHTQAGTEDGYGLGPGPHNGRPHSGDSDRDWKLGLIELTRVIELYNYRAGSQRTGEYHAQAGTEDGYAPGPGGPVAFGAGLHALAALATSAQEATATHAADSATYPTAGGTITISCRIAYAGTPSALGWQAEIPPGWSYVSGTGEPAIKPAAGQTDTLEWAWQDIPPSPIEFSYTLGVPAGQTGEQTLRAEAFYRAGGQLSRLPLASLVFRPAVPPPPELAINLYAGLVVSGVVGATYEIQYTTDLGEPVQWQPLGTVTLTRPVEVWIDFQSPGQPRRYYRAVAR